MHRFHADATTDTHMTAHIYSLSLTWTGNTGKGTSDYRAYDRRHEIAAPGKPAIPGSSDPHFRGDPARYNPEEMLVASLSACHMLWYLHLAATTSVVVTSYQDDAVGTMHESSDGRGRFSEVVLHPAVTIQAGSSVADAEALHHRAHDMCFIANSVNFPIRCEPATTIEATEAGA